MLEQFCQQHQPDWKECIEVTQRSLDKLLNPQLKATWEHIIVLLETALKWKFKPEEVAIDTRTLEVNMRNAIIKILLEKRIPTSVKEKFLDDIEHRILLIADIWLDTIEKLKVARGISTLWFDAIESNLKFSSTAELNGYYLMKILDVNIAKYIEPTAFALEVAFTADTIPYWWKDYPPKSYHRWNYQEFLKKLPEFYSDIQEQDKKFAFGIEEVTKNFFQDEYSLAHHDKFLDKEIGYALIEKLGTKLSSEAQNFLRIFFQSWLRPWFQYQKYKAELQIDTPSWKIDFFELWRSYTSVLKKHTDTFTKFNQYQDEFEGVKARSMDKDTWAWARSGLQMVFTIDHLGSDFTHVKASDIEGKIQHSSFSDCIILCNQLSQFTLAIGQFTGWIDAALWTVLWIDSQGEIHSTKERVILWLFATLGIIIPWVSALRKSSRFAELMKAFWKLKEVFPKKLEEFLELSKGKIPQDVQDKLATILWFLWLESLIAKVKWTEKISEIIPKRTSWRTSGVDIIERARVNGGLNDIPNKSWPIEWFWMLQNLSDRQIAFYERIKDMEEFKAFLQKAWRQWLEALLAWLVEVHNIHLDQNIGEHSLSQIKDKMSKWKSLELPEDFMKIALQEGFAWVFRVRELFKWTIEDVKNFTQLRAFLETIPTRDFPEINPKNIHIIIQQLEEYMAGRLALTEIYWPLANKIRKIAWNENMYLKLEKSLEKVYNEESLISVLKWIWMNLDRLCPQGWTGTFEQLLQEVLSWKKSVSVITRNANLRAVIEKILPKSIDQVQTANGLEYFLRTEYSSWNQLEDFIVNIRKVIYEGGDIDKLGITDKKLYEKIKYLLSKKSGHWMFVRAEKIEVTSNWEHLRSQLSKLDGSVRNIFLKIMLDIEKWEFSGLTKLKDLDKEFYLSVCNILSKQNPSEIGNFLQLKLYLEARWELWLVNWVENILVEIDKILSGGTFMWGRVSFSNISEWWLRPIVERIFLKTPGLNGLIIARAQKALHLWPDGFNNRLIQGNIGDCYLLATLHAFKSNPSLRVRLVDMIEPIESGVWRVTFPGSTNFFRVTMKDLEELTNRGVKWSLGDLIIERAYHKLRSSLKGQKPGQTYIVVWGRMGDDIAATGWTMKEVLSNFWLNLKQFESITWGLRISEFLKRYSKKPGDIAYLATISHIDGDRKFITISRGIFKEKFKLYMNHAYSLWEVDERKQMVEIINPHDTANKRFWITFQEIEKYFWDMSIFKGELGQWIQRAA